MSPTDTQRRRDPSPGRGAFVFIFVTVALDMLALGVMVPVLPKLVVQFEGGDIARAASVTGVFGLRGIGGMLGPLLFTQAFAAAIRPGAMVHLPGTPYLLAAVLLIASALGSWRVTRSST